MLGTRSTLALLVLAGCAPDVERETARYALAQVGSCALPELPELTLTVAGDFPSLARPLSARSASSLTGLPYDARAVSVSGSFAGGRLGAVAPVDRGSTEAPLLLLPLDESCPLGDTFAFAPPGAAVAATPRGGLLIAGGVRAGTTLASAAVLPPASTLGHPLEGALLLRRSGATATTFAGGVVIAGGAQDDLGQAHDTFEVYDEAADRFTSQHRLAGGARRGHAAVLLGDGRVLLAGGQRKAEGEALASAERLTPDGGEAEELRGALRQARVEPVLLALDDGRVLALLGHAGGPEGAAALPFRSVEQLARGAERFELVTAELPGPIRAPARLAEAVVALEGNRVAHVACEATDPCRVGLLLPAGDELEYVPDAIPSELLGTEGASALGKLRLAALRDGSLLLTAEDAGGDPRAFALDLSFGVVSELPRATRAPDHLVALADGTLAELDQTGVSLRRHDTRSAYHDPTGPLVSGDELAVALGAASRFVVEEDGLRAVRSARLDVPFLRFARVRVELRVAGAGRLLLEPEHAAPIAIDIAADSIAIGDCRAAGSANADVSVEREGTEVTLRAGGDARTCSLPGLSGLVGLALELERDSRVSDLRVERR